MITKYSFLAVFALVLSANSARAVECADFDIEGTWKDMGGQSFRFTQEGCKQIEMTDQQNGWKYEFKNMIPFPSNGGYVSSFAPGSYLYSLSQHTGVEINAIEYALAYPSFYGGKGTDLFAIGTFSAFGFTIKMGAEAKIQLVERDGMQVLQVRVRKIGLDPSAKAPSATNGRWFYKGVEFALKLVSGLLEGATFDLLQRKA